MLERSLPDVPINPELSSEEALAQLSAFLKPRIEAAEWGEFSPSTFPDIKQKARNNIQS
ncbi:hypothetical protein LYNGBM3L_66000 [Moorena producens 3L]|uniref:Uncharacterized protein n=1 Tax=Moorena producens 3L TaxID=489825 RepID=F4Y1B9_9CYAN|nr:hypothetical protein LYNGBM3L_66000 [Moorena producens 3L]